MKKRVVLFERKGRKGEALNLIWNALPKENKKIIENALKLKTDVTEHRKYCIKTAWIKYADLIEQKIFPIEKDTVTEAVGRILSDIRLSPRTRMDYYTDIKLLYRLISKSDDEIPKVCRGLKKLNKPKIKGFGNHLTRADMYSEENIKLLIDNSLNARDKFWHAQDFDAPLRKCEKLRENFGDIKKYGNDFILKIKTGKESGDEEFREILLIKSLPYYLEWRKTYPGEIKGNSPIFSRLDKQERVTENTIDGMYRRLRKLKNEKNENVINFRIMPKIGRHSFVTRASNGDNGRKIDTQILKVLLGHTADSNQISKYNVFSSEDTKKAQREYHGIKSEKEFKKEIREIKPQICSLCETSNTSDALVCVECRHTLNQDPVYKNIEMENRLAKIEEIMNVLKTDDRFKIERNPSPENLIEIKRKIGKKDEIFDESLAGLDYVQSVKKNPKEIKNISFEDEED